MDLKDGLPLSVHHYYLRSLDDLVLKEGGVVSRTLANSTGRKSVALGGVAAAQPLVSFLSRHARVAFLLRVLDCLPDQKNAYVLLTDQVMLDRLRDQASVDLGLVKAELKRSVDNIYGVCHQHSICN